MAEQTDAPDTNKADAASTAGTDQTVDWQEKYESMKAHSRKWEERAKSNSQAAEQLEQLRAQSDEKDKTITDLQSRLEGYETAEKKRGWAAKVSKDTGIPVELLDADSEEGMRAQASRLAKYLKPHGLPGQGSVPTGSPKNQAMEAFAHRLLSGSTD